MWSTKLPLQGQQHDESNTKPTSTIKITWHGNYDNLSFEERNAMMAVSEKHEREIRKQEQLLKTAKLK
ncbi:MAG: hypothetical protein ABJH28_19385, partial [Paraglaciecola sp.]